jgi:hypothetical protein
MNNLFHLRRYVNVFAMVPGVEGEIFSVEFHGCAILLMLRPV